MKIRICDNCGERFAEDERPIAVGIPIEGEQQPPSMFASFLGQPAPETVRWFELCSPRCVVSFFIAAGAISNGAPHA